MPESQITTKSKDGLKLVGREWKPAGAVRGAVCLVHGIGEHTGRYPHVAAALNQAGYAVLGLDLRGHGLSEGQRGFTPSYDALLDDLDVALDETRRRFPSLPLFFYGHSLGGNLVLYHSIRRKPSLAGVVASGPALRPDPAPPAWKTGIGRLMLNIWPSMSMANGLDLTGLSHDEAVVRAYKADPMVHDRVTPWLGIGLIDAGLWLLQHAAEFPLPLLIFHGSQDRLTSPDASREFAAKVKGDCTIKIWEGLYHETHNEPQKAEVLAFMIQWLKAHTP
jgi:alpha-beta hydrolase superfamily lysophospholipase